MSSNLSARGAGGTHDLGNRAVVLGAGMSGLLAARVLADFYAHVTVVDRDNLSIDGRTRPGVPQGGHAHLLLPRGAKVMEKLFPGLFAELREGGVPVARGLDQLHFDFRGHVLSQQKLGGDPHYGVSRPFLEDSVLRRVKSLPNLSLLDKHEVISLESDSSGTRVTGARIACGAAPGGDAVVPADLVVAATGHGGRMDAWLTELGYPVPRTQQVKVDVMYATRRFRLSPGATRGVLGVLAGPTPDRPLGMTAFAQEGGEWVVTLACYGRQHPPAELGPWLTFAARVAPPWFLSALLGARPVGNVDSCAFPASLRRRYDKLEAFPEGLLAVGDEVCSLNPIYAQGMTLAALESLVLRDALGGGRNHLAKRFFSAAAKPVSSAWHAAVNADLTMPSDIVPGARSLPLRAVNAYVGGFQNAAERDPALALQLLKVTGLEKPARSLLAPRSLGRIVASVLSRSRDGAANERSALSPSSVDSPAAPAGKHLRARR